MLRAAILAAILVPRLAYAGCETILATDSTKLSKTGDTMTGTFILTAPFTMTGADSYATFPSSVNAQGVWGTFTGNLTGNVTGSCSANVLKAGDTMTGPLTVPNIIGPTTVTAGSMTVAAAFLADTSSAPVVYIGTQGTAAAPSIAAPNTDSGIFWGSAGNVKDMGFTVNGVQRAVVQVGVGICGGTGQSSGQPCMRSSAGSKTDPAFQFISDGNTGIYRKAADDIRVAAGGSDAISATASEVRILPESVVGATFTATSGLSMAGAAGYIVTQSSIVTSGGFFGDGSGLTNLPAGADALTAEDAYSVWQTMSPSAASSTTIHGLDFSTYWYRVEAELSNGSNALYYIRCEEDSGNDYKFAGRCEATAGGATNVSGGTSLIPLTYNTAGRALANYTLDAEFTMKRDRAVSNMILFRVESNYYNSTPNREGCWHTGEYQGAGTVTKCAIVAGAGSMTGTVKVWRIAR